MPSKTPIFPLRLDPAVRARLEAIIGPDASLNSFINRYLMDFVQSYDMRQVQQKLESAPAMEPPSRNGMCSCGSGKKFKRCCGR